MARPPRPLAALALSLSRAAGAQGPRVVSSEETEASLAVRPGARVHDPFAQRRRGRLQDCAPDRAVRVYAGGVYVGEGRALREATLSDVRRLERRGTRIAQNRFGGGEVHLSGAVIIAYR